MGTLSPRPEHTDQANDASRSDALHTRWCTVHARSCQIAEMADLAPEPLDSAASQFETAFAQATGPILTIAHHGVEDIELLVDLGLKALEEVQARGQDTGAPALALWREFYHAREAVLAILEPAAA